MITASEVSKKPGAVQEHLWLGAGSGPDEDCRDLLDSLGAHRVSSLVANRMDEVGTSPRTSLAQPGFRAIRTETVSTKARS